MHQKKKEDDEKMGYEIFYDKRFLLVGEDGYIPIIQHGSNNCTDWNFSTGREVAEKNWSCINYPFDDRFVFSEEEVMEIAHACNDGNNAKSRGRSFSEEEFIRFFKNGIKGAKPLEYYLEFGNTFVVSDITDYKDPRFHFPNSTEEMLQMIEKLQSEGKSVSIGFRERKLILPRRNRVEKEKVLIEQDHYFALSYGYDYLYKLRKYGYSYSSYKSSAKRFKTEKEAEKYLDKYSGRLSNFEVERINEPYRYYS